MLFSHFVSPRFQNSFYFFFFMTQYFQKNSLMRAMQLTHLTWEISIQIYFLQKYAESISRFMRSILLRIRIFMTTKFMTGMLSCNSEKFCGRKQIFYSYIQVTKHELYVFQKTFCFHFRPENLIAFHDHLFWYSFMFGFS